MKKVKITWFQLPRMVQLLEISNNNFLTYNGLSLPSRPHSLVSLTPLSKGPLGKSYFSLKVMNPGPFRALLETQ